MYTVQRDLVRFLITDKRAFGNCGPFGRDSAIVRTLYHRIVHARIPVIMLFSNFETFRRFPSSRRGFSHYNNNNNESWTTISVVALIMCRCTLGGVLNINFPRLVRHRLRRRRVALSTKHTHTHRVYVVGVKQSIIKAPGNAGHVARRKASFLLFPTAISSCTHIYTDTTVAQTQL